MITVVVEQTILCTVEFPEGEGFNVAMDDDDIEGITNAAISQSCEIACGRERQLAPDGKLAFDRIAWARIYSERTDFKIIEDERVNVEGE
jgi:hypothetical protein